MFFPKFNLVYNEDNHLTYREPNNKIFKENILKKLNKNFIDFINEPMSGWKVSYEKNLFVPLRNQYAQPSMALTHPTNDTIKFPINNFNSSLPFITIKDGVIQEKIILTLSGTDASFVSERSPDYENALNILDKDSKNEVSTVKDLQVGDIFTYKGMDAIEAIYLGSYFLRKINYTKRNNSISINKPREYRIILTKIFDEDYPDCFEFSIIPKPMANSSLKEISIIDNLPIYHNIDLGAIFNVKKIDSNFHYIKYFSGDELVNPKTNYSQDMILFSQDNISFSTKDSIIEIAKKLELNITEDNIEFVDKVTDCKYTLFYGSTDED